MKLGRNQRLRVLAAASAAIIPGAVLLLQTTNVSDMAKGLVVGVLIGLAVLALVRTKTCAD